MCALFEFCKLCMLLFLQLNPSTVWLREESPGSRVFFPDAQNTRFLLSEGIGTDLVAMGSSIQTTSPITSSAARVPSIASSQEPSTSGMQHQTQFSARKTQSSNVKIVQASMKHLASGKIEFIPQNQTFVDVTETTANLHLSLIHI